MVFEAINRVPCPRTRWWDPIELHEIDAHTVLVFLSNPIHGRIMIGFDRLRP